MNNNWKEEFDKEFEVVTEVEYGHQHFQSLPTPDKFKAFISKQISEAENRGYDKGYVEAVRFLEGEQSAKASHTPYKIEYGRGSEEVTINGKVYVPKASSDMPEIVKEFVEGTPAWHKALLQGYHDKPCFMCGIIPDNLLELSKAISNQSESLVSSIEKMKKEYQFSKEINWSSATDDSIVNAHVDAYNGALKDVIKLIQSRSEGGKE